jgi:hypothetical protein
MQMQLFSQVLVTHARRATGDLELRALLCDFGYTKITSTDNITSSSLSNGSLPWHAWELVHPQELMVKYNDIAREDRVGYLLPRSDVWSWGMTALVCPVSNVTRCQRMTNFLSSLFLPSLGGIHRETTVFGAEVGSAH